MYIGKTPTVGNFQVCDAISVVNGQAAYTLQVGGTNVAPESANHMLVSLNGILQKPGSSYTISSSTMTFASNLATGDVIDFVQILGNVLDIGQPSDDTVTAAKLATTSITGQTAETSAADAVTILIHDNSASALRKMTRSNFLSGVGGANTPNFKTSNSGNTSCANNTFTKLSIDTEAFDSDSAFASDKFTVPSGKGGKYIFVVAVYMPVNTGSADYAQVLLYKNGSNVSSTAHTHSDSNIHNHVSINNVSAGDYFEVYFRQSTGGSQNAQVYEFSGFRLIE